MSTKLEFLLQAITILTLLLQSHGYSDRTNHLVSKTSQPQPYSEIDVIEGMPAPKPGWIDPFDMLGESRQRDSLFVQSEVDLHILEKRCSSYEVYLRRFVNMFLQAVELRDGPATDYSYKFIKLEFTINGYDIDILKEFGRATGSAKIEKVDEIFSKIFSQKKPQGGGLFDLRDFFIWFQKAFIKVISSPEWTVFSSVVLLMFLTLWLVYYSHSYRMAMFTVLVTIFLAGFGFTWIRMYEEKEVERYVNIMMYGEIPRHCSNLAQTMAWYEHVYYRMFGVDCLQFTKIRDVRPIVKISPTDVLVETFSSMIIGPATNIATAYASFVSTMMHILPWWLKPIGLPLSFIMPIFFLTVLLAFIFNYRLSFSITGFHLIPSWSHTSQSKVEGGRNQYIEECPCKETNSSQQNNTGISFLNSDAPLFLMNWKAIKKLSSSSLTGEKSEKSKKEEKETEEAREKEVEDHQSLNDESEKMIEELKEFEKLAGALEAQKLIEDHKKLPNSSAEGGSVLTSRRRDLQEAMIKESSDSLFGVKSRASASTDTAKDFKDKTT